MALDIASFVIEKLTNPVLQEASLLYGVAGKVASVKRTLEHVKVSIEAAEKKGKGKDPRLNLLVDQLRDVSFRIEDAVDIYLLEIKGDRTTARHGGCHSFGFIRRFYKILKNPVALHNLGVELDDIIATLNEIDENNRRFNINADGPETTHWEANPSIKRRYEFPNNEIVGLENEKKAIVDKLLDPQAQNLRVISIVGPGGLGKTTLVRKVFHSTEVIGNFDKRIWIPVSREFNTISILKKMLEKCGTVDKEEKDQDIQYFINGIRSCFKKKKVLVVLDDIWDETLWPNIRMVCPPDMDCGRVLITTRNSNVAKKAQSEPYEPKLLNLEESKTLLFKVSFPNEEPPKGLDSAATEIAKKCRGLPLAIVVVGGRLYMEQKNSEWRRVAESIDWGKDEECMQILEASYDDLSSALKMRFIYLASFPEDYRIDANSLVQTWVGEGLASDEENAQDYLQELAQRCLVIVTGKAYDGLIEMFWVHDLLLELAIKKANETKFMSVFTKQTTDQVSFNNARRASFQARLDNGRSSNNSENERKVKKRYNKRLRSLLVFETGFGFQSNKIVLDDLSGFRMLKVLKVHNCVIEFSTLEKWCEKLIHLRHLELGRCYINGQEIPESIGHLQNLLTLNCADTKINKLPRSLWSIKTLRHVVVQCDNIHPVKVPLQSTELPNLRTLRYVALQPVLVPPFSIPNPRFPNLLDLALYGIETWTVTLLKESKKLISLELDNSRSIMPLPMDIFDMRGFPWYQILQRLLLSGWPKPVELHANLFLPNLTMLSLHDCAFKKDPMPELQQLQYLEILVIAFEPYKAQWFATLTCSAGGFPQLQELYLRKFYVVEFNIAPESMPMLKKLVLTDFLAMKNIPKLQHLKLLRDFHWTGTPYTDAEIEAVKEKDQAKLQMFPQL